MVRRDICRFGEYRVFLVLDERLAVMGQQVNMTEAQCDPRAVIDAFYPLMGNLSVTYCPDWTPLMR